MRWFPIPLPPVLPIVLYNGAESWTAKADFADLIDANLPPQTQRIPKDGADRHRAWR
jgi:hypothetical protein